MGNKHCGHIDGSQYRLALVFVLLGDHNVADLFHGMPVDTLASAGAIASQGLITWGHPSPEQCLFQGV